MKIAYSRRFIKEFKRCPKKIQIAFKERLELFVANQSHPLLNNHVLIGEWRRCHSINITGDWRALYQELEGGELIFFIILGTHSQLYK